MNQSEIDLSVIIINYNTPELTCKCIQSVYDNSEGLIVEIIVIDNFSKDNSLTLIKSSYPNINLIKSEYNSGFGTANNIGIKKAKGKYTLLLNSDAELTPNCLLKSINYYKLQEKTQPIGVLGCHIVGYDGVTQFNSNIDFSPIKELYYKSPFYAKKYGALKEKRAKEKENLHKTTHMCRFCII